MNIILPIVCAVIGITLWYFYYGFECYMNGASTWAHPIFMPFQCLWQEIGWLLIPGRKADFVRDEVIGLKYGQVLDGVIMGSRKSWRYHDVVDNRLYKQCARDVMPGPLHFFFTHIFLPLFPLVIWAALHYRV